MICGGSVAVWFTTEEKIAVLEAAGYVVEEEEWAVPAFSGRHKLVDYRAGLTVRDLAGELVARPDCGFYREACVDKAFNVCLRKMLSVVTAGKVKEVGE